MPTNIIDEQYCKLLKCMYTNSKDGFHGNRTATRTYSEFNPFQNGFEIDLSQKDKAGRYYFPLLTSKFVPMRIVAEELRWFLSGDTNNKTLMAKDVHIWQEWASDDGDLGRIYGKQWRAYGDLGIDQIKNLIVGLREDPYSRRHIVDAWNPEDIAKGNLALPPCHMFFQCYVNPVTKQIDMTMYQRSADLFLGVPFNIASYALLLHLIANLTGYNVGKLFVVFGDVHIYENHLEAIEIQLKNYDDNCSKPVKYDCVQDQINATKKFKPKYLLKSPTIETKPNQSMQELNDFTAFDYKICDYEHLGRISAEVAV